MYKTILVPVDGSTRAEAILPHVEDLARHYQARVVLIHVLEPSLFTLGPEGFFAETNEVIREIVSDVREYLSALQARFERQGISATTRLEQGPIIPLILKVAEAEKADLIAMSSHGRTGLTRAFYGSVAGGLLHQIDRPLLLIRSEGE